VEEAVLSSHQEMIQQIEGDLLDFPNGINVIAHSCNCQNTMGAGIADQIRRRYPAAFKADTQAAKNKENILGEFSYARVTNPPDPARYVCNLYTQQFYGRDRRHVSYDAFATSLSKLDKMLRQWQEASGRKVVLGLPYLISCKNAGGSWKVINAIIEDTFDWSSPISPIDVFIVRNPLYD
jgi:O-acetyl-ADP-ribose deacetylase (regulator of RNase III)